MSAKTRPAAVGSAAFTSGQVTRGELVLAQHLGGPVAAPVMIATGARPGPTLWVQAAIHGGEVGGTLGIARCLNRIDLAAMSGAVVGILAANPLAYRAQTRNTPEDGENMNRLFPGDAGGTVSRVMAHSLMSAAEATADTVMDFHSGGLECVVPFYSLYWDDDSAASRQAGAYARSAATDIVWTARDPWLGGAMFTQLTKRGLPALIVESGGAEVTDDQVETFAAAIAGVARAMAILPGGPIRQADYHLVGSCDLVFARKAGFFVPACAAGDTLEQGGVVGRIIDAFGTEQEVVTTPKRAFLAAVARHHLPVNTGALIAELNDDLGRVKP